MRLRHRPRRAATVVEFAIVAPLTFLLILGLLIGGLGIFRYQQVAHLAREASRWAAVHGADYEKETGKPAATADDVYKQVIAPKAMALDLSKLTYKVTWDKDNRRYYTKIVNGDVVAVTNKVTVTITYQWMPEAFLGGITLSSTSESTMAH